MALLAASAANPDLAREFAHWATREPVVLSEDLNYDSDVESIFRALPCQRMDHAEVGAWASEEGKAPMPSESSSEVEATASDLTAQGRRTRAALIRAARRVFERKGYMDARIVDITKSARVATGSFYNYFESKEQIFEVMLTELQAELFTIPADGSRSTPPIERIRSANRRYLEFFQQWATLWAAVEEAAITNSDVRTMIERRRRTYNERTERAILHWINDGEASPRVSAGFAAAALGAMTERCAYLWYVFGSAPDLNDGVDALTQLWARSLRLERMN